MVLFLSALVRSALAFGGALPHEADVVGVASVEVAAEGDSLVEMARRYDLGFSEIATANPALDPFVPGAGARVVIPTTWLVPEVARGTILVNVSELRLYLLIGSDESPLVVTFPVGVGVEGAPTPVGSYRVVAKEIGPTWVPPQSLRLKEPELPPSVPPGPENPLGEFALRLSNTGILIHGTNRPWGVGRRVSHGCIRLYPEDIPVLYRLVPVGAVVQIVRWPVKVGLAAGRVYIEVHQDDEAGVNLLEEARRLLARSQLLEEVDPDKIEAAVKERRGKPVDVGL